MADDAWYHAIIDFYGKTRYWWNRTREETITNLLIPLLSKQVLITTRRERKVLFNFGAVSYMSILKTSEKLKRQSEGQAPAELKSRSFVKQHDVTEEFVNEIKVLQAHHLTRSLIQQSILVPQNQLFVIMKFGDPHLDSAYDRVINPLGAEFGFKVLRVDRIQDSGNISDQILRNIGASKLVLAELSEQRPNCYYEAGYAHALGKEIIFTIRKGQPIHFDLAGYRFIQWDTEAEFATLLRQRLSARPESEAD